MRAQYRFFLAPLLLVLWTACSSVAPRSTAAIGSVKLAAAEDIDTQAWHFLICTRQTETKQLEIHVGKSDQDYAVLTWNEGEAPAIPVPQAYLAEPTLWVRVRL